MIRRPCGIFYGLLLPFSQESVSQEKEGSVQAIGSVSKAFPVQKVVR